MKIIGFISQKGGQGKSTLSNALAYALKERGARVLLVDFDSQASQTVTFGFDPTDFARPGHPSDITNIFRRQDVEPVVIDDNLHLIPSNSNLWSASESAPTAKDMMLKRYLGSVADRYDYAIVDTKGGASTLMNNIVIAADTLAVPVKTSFLDEAATAGLLDIVDAIVESYDLSSKRLVLIPNLFNRTTANSQVSFENISNSGPLIQKAKQHYSEVVVTCPFPDRTVISSAFAYSQFLQPYIMSAKKPVAIEIMDALNDIVEKITPLEDAQ